MRYIIGFVGFRYVVFVGWLFLPVAYATGKHQYQSVDVAMTMATCSGIGGCIDARGPPAFPCISRFPPASFHFPLLLLLLLVLVPGAWLAAKLLPPPDDFNQTVWACINGGKSRGKHSCSCDIEGKFDGKRGVDASTGQQALEPGQQTWHKQNTLAHSCTPESVMANESAKEKSREKL